MNRNGQDRRRDPEGQGTLDFGLEMLHLRSLFYLPHPSHRGEVFGHASLEVRKEELDIETWEPSEHRCHLNGQDRRSCPGEWTSRRTSEDSLIQVNVASGPTLSPASILFYVFVLFSLWCISLKPFPPCLTPHSPMHIGAQREVNQEAGLQRPTTASRSIWIHCPPWSGSTALQRPSSLMMLVFCTAVSSFLSGQHPLGSLVYPPTYRCLSPVTNCFRRTEGGGQTSDSHFWTSPVMCKRLLKWPIWIRIQVITEHTQELEGTAFRNVTFQPTGVSSLLNPRMLCWIIRHKPRHKCDFPRQFKWGSRVLSNLGGLSGAGTHKSE